MLPSDSSAYEFDAQLLERGLPGSGDYVAIARPDGRGGYVAPVWITRNERDVIWVSEPDWEGEGTFSEFDLGGRTMEFVSDQSGAGRIVQFDVGDGTAVVIDAVGSAGMTRDELGRIALALHLDGAALGLETPPDGYEVVATGRLGEVPEPLRTMNVWRAGEQFAGLSVTMTSNPGFPFRDIGGHDRARDDPGTGWLGHHLDLAERRGTVGAIRPAVGGATRPVGQPRGDESRHARRVDGVRRVAGCRHGRGMGSRRRNPRGDASVDAIARQ